MCKADRLLLTHWEEQDRLYKAGSVRIVSMAMLVNKLNKDGKALYRLAFKGQSCGKPPAAPPEVLSLPCVFCSAALAKPAAQPHHLARLDSFFYWKASKS
jgi:hypothetical protein